MTAKQDFRPCIGVFDSGVGGLTVLKELLRLLPHAAYLYFGDTARLPYGSKSTSTVAKHSIASAQFLQARGAEYLVIACNTATALALEAIRNSVSIPVVGVIEPGARRAAELSRSRKVVVIGTEATIGSHAYRIALEQHGISVKEKACPLLVPLVEEGWTDTEVTEKVARIYLDDAFRGPSEHADVLLLGCTHYPLLRPVLRRVAPAYVTIVDSAQSTALAVADKLQVPHPPADAMKDEPVPEEESSIEFFATDSVEKFRRLGERFLERKIQNVSHVDVEEEAIPLES
jgi:glutamate racemase